MKPIELQIGDIVDTMTNPVGGGKVYYMFGHREELAARLTEKEKDKEHKYQKYPLVALRVDTIGRNNNGVHSYKLNLVILTLTNKGYWADKRLEKVFIPILIPLYEQFMKKLRDSGLFTWSGDQEMPNHIDIRRYYWGTPATEKNVANIFNDPLDAIEIVDLDITTIKTC